MSARNLAERDTLQIDPMQGYFSQQIQPDTENLAYWEVYDRTTGEKYIDWEWNDKGRCVLVKNARSILVFLVSRNIREAIAYTMLSERRFIQC